LIEPHETGSKERAHHTHVTRSTLFTVQHLPLGWPLAALYENRMCHKWNRKWTFNSI